MREILIPIGLVLLGLLLVGSEAFVPSAGILGILAAACLVGGIVMAYYYGGAAIGTLFLVVTGAGVACLIWKMVKWWPSSTIGKRILVEPPSAEDLLVDRSETRSMVGRYGKTLGLMVPGGFVEIDGKRFDAVADNAIEADTWVKVTRITGGRILNVLPVEAEIALKAIAEASESNSEGSASPVPADDLFADPFADS